MREAARVSDEEIRAFIAQHFVRNPNCNWDHVFAGFRVKFGRPMDSAETALARAAFDEEEIARDERLDAAWAAAEARKPKGPINKFLAMRWPSQMMMGLAIFLVALYGLSIVFYDVVSKNVLAGGTGAPSSGSLAPPPTLSPGSAGLKVEIFDHPGIQAATSILFWTVLVTGGVGGVVILFISWGIGYGVMRASRALLRRPATG